MSKILGLNMYHADSSAALVVDGKVVHAVEEERIRRIKHWAGFPSESIRQCLIAHDIDFSDIDFVAINRNPFANLAEKMRFVTANPQFWKSTLVRLRSNKQTLSTRSLIENHFPEFDRRRTQIRYIEHHDAHIASSFFVSGFTESAYFSLDGFGDFSSTTYGEIRGNKTRRFGNVSFPHSMGVFYSAITQFLGFWKYGDEYKVMGLASYGSPRFVKEMRELVNYSKFGTFSLDTKFFLHDSWMGFKYEVADGSPRIGQLWSSRFADLFGPNRNEEDEIDERHADIASSAQLIYEEVFGHMLRSLHSLSKIEKLSFAGGCAQNSVANGKIQELSPYSEVFIPPASGDAGGAIGAALKVAMENSEIESSFEIKGSVFSPYLGPGFTQTHVDAFLADYESEFERNDIEVSKHENFESTSRVVSEHIRSGLVVGWFQGRMEFGPRALGNRSILVDPRRTDAQDYLNLKIKRREPFRPFAPSVLIEYVNRWFEDFAFSPYMEQVLRLRAEMKEKVPAVVHVDGSSRLQTVSRELNPKFHMLISDFHRLTGVPMLLNTSFNENEPIVMTPKQAIDCFLRTKMDILVLENTIISRSQNVNENTN